MAPTETTNRYLSPDSCRAFDRDHADGATTHAILEFFGANGVTISEATFRRYVQLGLVPRSTRVGQKGKHRGSCGVYPPGTVAQVNDIRRLTRGELTLEDLANSHFRFQKELNVTGQQLDAVLDTMEQALGVANIAGSEKANLLAEHRTVRRATRDLLKRIAALAARVSPLKDSHA